MKSAYVALAKNLNIATEMFKFKFFLNAFKALTLAFS